jgi:hypothetical protein
MIKLIGHHFKDESGRTLILRGVNLGGRSKIPVQPNGATWNREGFYEHHAVSFVGRPFPLNDADEHFQRLRAWGFTFLRFLITWEAVEHVGPGIYDQEYLNYLYQVVKKAGEFGLDVFIDPHQDVWSRFTGGDGAPGWTLESAGMDLSKLHTAGAALLHQEHGANYPPMIWPTNINRLAAATMFTLFFGGSDFAPRTKVGGLSIQEYLQSHYINAVKQVALKLNDLPNVIGFETLNEPFAGYIGATNVADRAISPLLKGESPTIFQAMLLGAGFPQQVDIYDLGLTRFVKKGARVVNAGKQSIWREGYEDIWKQNGVWGLDSSGLPQILVPDYFCKVGSRKVDFYRDYFKPFANLFAQEIRSISPNAIIFVEGVPQQGELNWNMHDAPDIVHVAHWYDGLTLMNKSFNSWFTVDPRNLKIHLGNQRVRRCFADQVAGIHRQSDEQMSHAPTLIGEVGVPFDLQKKRAYRTGDFSMQIKALDATMSALEKNLACFTLWNYTADNTNEHGDQWNDEDFSIFSRDQQLRTGDVYDGGRGIRAVVRPYAASIPGEPLSMSFDIKTRCFHFTFRCDPEIRAPLVVFIPAYHYPKGTKVQVTKGRIEMDLEKQRLEYFPDVSEFIHTMTISPS